MSNQDLREAWERRERQGVIAELRSLRVFHGPGEGRGALKRVAIDRFEEAFSGTSGATHYWITEWEGEREGMPGIPLDEIGEFLRSRGGRSAVALVRPGKGAPAEPRALFGEVPRGRWVALEEGARFLIQLEGVRHPGLFLDHYPLRRWLRTRANGLSVLNTFSYTGSLSIASGLGGATQVTTLDLSKATIAWAEENWRENGLPAERARFVAGDYFEWLPRFKREGRAFDLVILDPPSFSRGKKGNFSTAKDLRKLHALAFSVLKPGALLITSINSSNVPWMHFADEVLAAARDAGVELQVLSRIDLPETFPTRMEDDSERYLKGWILRISSGTGASKAMRSRDMGWSKTSRWE